MANPLIAGLSRPGAGDFFTNLGLAALAAGQGGQPIGTNRFAQAAPYIQAAIQAPAKAHQALQAQKYRAAVLADLEQRTAREKQERIARENLAAGLGGRMPGPPHITHKPRDREYLMSLAIRSGMPITPNMFTPNIKYGVQTGSDTKADISIDPLTGERTIIQEYPSMHSASLAEVESRTEGRIETADRLERQDIAKQDFAAALGGRVPGPPHITREPRSRKEMLELGVKAGMPLTSQMFTPKIQYGVRVSDTQKADISTDPLTGEVKEIRRYSARVPSHREELTKIKPVDRTVDQIRQMAILYAGHSYHAIPGLAERYLQETNKAREKEGLAPLVADFFGNVTGTPTVDNQVPTDKGPGFFDNLTNWFGGLWPGSNAAVIPSASTVKGALTNVPAGQLVTDRERADILARLNAGSPAIVPTAQPPAVSPVPGVSINAPPVQPPAGQLVSDQERAEILARLNAGSPQSPVPNVSISAPQTEQVGQLVTDQERAVPDPKVLTDLQKKLERFNVVPRLKRAAETSQIIANQKRMQRRQLYPYTGSKLYPVPPKKPTTKIGGKRAFEAGAPTTAAYKDRMIKKAARPIKMPKTKGKINIGELVNGQRYQLTRTQREALLQKRNIVATSAVWDEAANNFIDAE